MPEQTSVNEVETQETDVETTETATVAADTEEFDIDKARQLFGLSEGIKAVSKLKTDINSRKLSVIKEEDFLAEIENRLQTVTTDELKVVPADIINTFFIHNGGQYNFEIDFESPEKEIAFKRDYLVYLKESRNAIQEIDKQMEEMTTELSAHQDEFNKMTAAFGGIDNYIESEMRSRYAKSEGAEKERMAKVIESFENAVNFNNVYEHFKTQNTANVIKDMNSSRIHDIYKRYRKVIQLLNITTDVADFDGLEEKYLPKEYHVHPNLFLFAIIKMYAYKKDYVTKSTDGVFLAQLNVNLRRLYNDQLDEAKKEEMVNSICRVLDLFI